MVNRIMGILVVLAMGVLLSPFLISRYDNALQAEMVEAPPFPSQQAQNATIEALNQETSLSRSQKTNKSLAELSASTKTAKLKNHAKADAWIIQLGASKDKLSALRLANQLRAKGYNAFIYQKGAAFGEEVSVFIGPELKRNSAEMLASQITKETKLSTTVKSYKPLAA